MNCSLCKETGKIHPLLANGKTDWSRLVYCKCSPRSGQVASEPLDLDQPEKYLQDNSGLPMFDFPCSYTFRQYEAVSFEKLYLPEIEKEPEPLTEAITQNDKLLSRHHRKIQEHDGQLIHIKQVLLEHLKPKMKPEVKKGGVQF